MKHEFMAGWDNGQRTASCVKCGMVKDHPNHEQPSK